MNTLSKITFLDITFVNTNFESCINSFSKGGIFLFPSGPGLAEIYNDSYYFKSLKQSSFNFFDSGLFVLLLKLKGLNVRKFSGYLFFIELIKLF